MIIIIDFGSQYTQLISRRIKELGVLSEICAYDKSLPFNKKDINGIILAGSPSSASSGGGQEYIQPPSETLQMGVPVLGICYGMQVMARMLGGEVKKSGTREYGDTVLKLTGKTRLLKGVPQESRVWMSHGDRVVKTPEGFNTVAETEAGIGVIADESRSLYGVQFHPEVAHTDKGGRILSNFVFNICGSKKDWNLVSWIDEEINQIEREVGSGRVIMALSGGVDSSVAAVMIRKAIGDRFHPVYVDHGLMRFKDGRRIRDILIKKMGLKVKTVECGERFLAKLKGVRDPEKKRKIIGNEFVKVFTEEAESMKGITHLAQGTLYPDIIESAGDGTGASKIKSHHNVGGLPEKLHLKLLEPLKLLYKDEVRKIGEKLGLPQDIIKEHPFPGPGLAVRIMGAVNSKRADILRKADNIVDQELKNAGLYYNLWQAFCVFLPVKTVGVMGDARTYENVIALRFVDSDDAMTANWSKIPYEILSRISTRIVNEVKGVNRVVYDITNKPPGTIEWQ